jgi:tripartite-type tricarboxylate transporter receptor subunit TctC
MITGWMGLAPFGDLGGAHFLVLWAHNEVHSAFPSHQAARQTERVFFRGARASDGVPIQSPIKIVRCPTHASTIARSVAVTRKRKGPRPRRHQTAITILINDLALPSAPYLRKSLPINVRTDLTPIGLINAGPLILIARKSMRADTAAQMFALFKAEQTNIKFGHGGTGTNSHMCGLLIQQALGVTFTSVPYRGTGPAMNDLLGGTLDTLCEQSQTALPQVLGDKVTADGVTSTARIISIPNVPTLAEAGLTGFDFLVWHGLYAPKGTPDTIVEALNRALNSSLDDPTIRQRYVEMGRIEFPLDQRTPAAQKARLNSEIDRLGKLLEAAGIKPEE